MSLSSWLRIHHLKRANHGTRFVCAAAALAAISLTAPRASAAYVNVYGGPTYTPGVGGFKDGGATGVNDAGTAIGIAHKYNDSGEYLGDRAFRWDGSGAAATELGNLGADNNGFGHSIASAINAAGTVVGQSNKYDSSGNWVGERAVRWDASGTSATELGSLSANTSGQTQSDAYAINDAGMTVGWAVIYDSSGSYNGYRAVRWDRAGAAIELGNLGVEIGGYAQTSAHAINSAGTAVGQAEKHDSLGEHVYDVAARWDGSVLSATELGNLSESKISSPQNAAYAINDAGTAVGFSNKVDGSGMFLGYRAVRWETGGAAPTELGNLGTDASGATQSSASAINDAGTAVGFAFKYDDLGEWFGTRAVRWDASGTTAIELGHLGADDEGFAYSQAHAINDVGIVLGEAQHFDASDANLAYRPVYWGLDGVAVDLNTLLDPASGWTLDQASAISNTGWIAGSGMFDPDGAGGRAAYRRMFLMHVPATAVPEPAAVALFGVALVVLYTAARRRVRLRTHQFKRTSGVTRIVCAAAAALAAVTLTSSSASAAYVSVYGGPIFTPGVGGFKGIISVADVNDSGTAVGNAVKYDGSGVDLGRHAIRWDSSGAPAIELGRGRASDINEAGTAVGFVIEDDGLDAGYAAVRWNASGDATKLGHLGVDARDVAHSGAGAINDAGTAVGSSWKHNNSGTYRGVRAVRWDASGNAATELDNLGTNGGFALNFAAAINDAGATVGQADIDLGTGGGLGEYEYYGTRAVRWDAANTEATELGNLGTDPSGYTDGVAFAINDAGAAVGWANMYDVWKYLGMRAVRWDATGTIATELGNLGTDPNSITESSAIAINNVGTTVGYANLYDNSGESLGRRAVRWDACGTVATELGNLGTGIGPFYVSDFTETDVFAINDAGIAVGYADKYDDSGMNLGERAVYWALNGAAVDLNTLINPASGWTLNRATAISNTGWIGGSGMFDPDGVGGQEAYGRLFLLQVPATATADFDGDGDVDADDLAQWKGDFGVNSMSDGDSDGDSDGADFLAWQRQLGSGPRVTAASVPVPEPATVVLVILAAAGLCARPTGPE